ncbi:MAG: hypothetical protein OEL89_04825 [Candidatus Peregrinibacteria bacterium]|nr:hypothetical protein [Candidatus Peregrinibacteria bacterium]
MKRNPLSYIADLYHGATRHPFGGMKPHVVLGHFPKNETGHHVPVQEDGTNEFHVRFYDDGTIDCEREIVRFESMHWIGPRQHDLQILEDALERSVVIRCDKTKEKIRKLFGTKPYSDGCVR